MKVKELIGMLQAYDGEMLVVTSGYEGGYDEIAKTEEIELKLNVNEEWYYGPHERPDDDEKGDVKAVQLGCISR
jgi:hypothetical protein